MANGRNGARPKGKLELTWVGKENRPRLEPRILIEDRKLSYGDPNAENMLIRGDNLLALKALEQDFAGKIKCIFIDPPYNTGSAFAHYDDGIEHSLWLSLIRDRLEILWRLLSDKGSIWITIDDTECHYLKIVCDEVFGRYNFVCSIAWEKDQGRRGDTDISSAHDHILLYARDRDLWRKTRNLLPRSAQQESRYRNPDSDPRGRWLQGDNGTAKSGTESLRFPITLPSGRQVVPPKGNYWRFSKENFEIARADGRVHFGAKGDSMPVIKRYLTDVQQGVVPRTWWPAEEAGSNQDAKRDHLRKLLPEIEPFSTPKPEQLLQRVLVISTNPDDWVLDSFAGSGTTGAVAHKMGRRWIMVELGEHCKTHIIPRLRKVIDGSDQGGVSEAVGWKGGGGFKFFRLAESLLVTDKDLSTRKRPVYIINPKYDSRMLVRAICKIENFRYLRDNHWHGASSEHHFLYVTTSLLSQRHLDSVSAQLGDEEALLIYCTRRTHRLRVADNIEVKKIPRDLLAKCSFEEDRV